MNFLKRLFGVGSDNNDSKDDDRRREERRPEPSATPETKPQRSEAERERSQRPSRRRSNNPDERRNQQRRKRSDNERKPRRNNETGEESRSRGRSGDNNRRGRRPADRRGERRSRIEERPRATELSEYVLSTAEVVHDEERDKWRSLDFRKLDTVTSERTLAQDHPEDLDLPEPMRQAIRESLVWVSYDEELPEISFDEEGNKQIGGTEEQQRQPYFLEPSTIWTKAPISEGEGGRLKYSPSYLELTPEQRYEYLDWLTRKDKSGKWGYVFLYYNGLERHLLLGDLDRAVEEILKLRETFPWQHKLINASEYAVINSCFARRRRDLLQKLIDEGAFSGISLLQMTISYESDVNLGAEDLLNIFYKLYPEARTALHHDRDRLKTHVESALNKLTLYDGLPIYRYPIDDVKTKNEHRFLNDSFPEYLQGCVMPDFYSLDPFRNDVDLIFHTAFDAYKADAGSDENEEETMPEDKEE